jgi:hypothetical protein
MPARPCLSDSVYQEREFALVYVQRPQYSFSLTH